MTCRTMGAGPSPIGAAMAQGELRALVGVARCDEKPTVDQVAGERRRTARTLHRAPAPSREPASLGPAWPSVASGQCRIGEHERRPRLVPARDA